MDSKIVSMSESGPVTHLYRYAASSGLRRQEPVSGPARDVLSLATSGGVTEAGPAAHPYFFTGFLTSLSEERAAAALLLEVAARASAAAGVPELPGSITDLAASTNGSKLAEAARRLARARDVALRA